MEPEIVVILGNFALCAALIALGVYGVTVFGESGFVKTGLPSVIPQADFLGGYSSTQFWGAELMLFGLSLSVLPLANGSSVTLYAKTVPNVIKILVFLVLSGIFAYLSLTSLQKWHGREILDCFVVGCVFLYNPSLVDKEESLPNGFYPTLGDF